MVQVSLKFGIKQLRVSKSAKKDINLRVQNELAQISCELISSLTSCDFILEALFHEALFYTSS